MTARLLPALLALVGCFDSGGSSKDDDTSADTTEEVCDGVDNDGDGDIPELLSHGDRDYLRCHLEADARSWDDARALCEQAGMQLVVVDDADEAAFLASAWQDVRAEAISIDNHTGEAEVPAWIGLSDQSGEGDWQWVDGSAAPVDGWCPNEPNDHDEEDCAAIGWTAAYGGEPECPDGGWNDLSCETRLGFFCEAE